MAEKLVSTEPSTGAELWSGEVGDAAAEVALVAVARHAPTEVPVHGERVDGVLQGAQRGAGMGARFEATERGRLRERRAAAAEHGRNGDIFVQKAPAATVGVLAYTLAWSWVSRRVKVAT